MPDEASNPLTSDTAGFGGDASGLLSPAIEWWKRGGIAGSLGMPSAVEAAVAAGEKENVLSASGAGLAQQVAAGMDNPLLYAFGPGSIRGWHGTPHTFAPEPEAPLGRFKDEAIGTGEGAQAYGYGHYVAGNRSVGENYQPTDQYQISGGGNKWAAFKRLPSSDPTKDISPNFETREEAQQWAKDNSGNLLEVHILPEESELLD